MSNSSNIFIIITVLVTEITSEQNADTKSEKCRIKKLTEKPMENVPNASDNAIVNAFFPILKFFYRKFHTNNKQQKNDTHFCKQIQDVLI